MDLNASFSVWRFRLAGLGLTLVTVAILVTAGRLRPDGRGFGTHEQLGLPACQFHTLTGVLCPHCGMTTSFAHTVRGNIPQAVKANPCGPPLVLILATVVLPWSLGAVVFGRSLVVREPVWWFLIVSATYVVVAVIVWVTRMFL